MSEMEVIRLQTGCKGGGVGGRVGVTDSLVDAMVLSGCRINSSLTKNDKL